MHAAVEAAIDGSSEAPWQSVRVGCFLTGNDEAGKTTVARSLFELLIGDRIGARTRSASIP